MLNLKDFNGLQLPEAADPITVYLLRTQMTRLWSLRQFYDAALEFIESLPAGDDDETIPKNLIDIAGACAAKFCCFRAAIKQGPLHHKFKKFYREEMLGVIARVINALPVSGLGGNPMEWKFSEEVLNVAFDNLLAMSNQLDGVADDENLDDAFMEIVASALVPEVNAAPCNASHVEFMLDLVFGKGMDPLDAMDKLSERMEKSGEYVRGGGSIDNITFLSVGQRVILFCRIIQSNEAARRFASNCLRSNKGRQDMINLISAWDMVVGNNGMPEFQDGFREKLKHIAKSTG